MIPGVENIVVVRGGTFSLPIQYSDDAGLLNFETRYAGARLQVRPRYLGIPGAEPPDAPLLELTTANGGIVLTGTTCEIKMTAAMTAALAFKSGVYDLEFYIGSGVGEIVDKMLKGSVSVSPEATV